MTEHQKVADECCRPLPPVLWEPSTASTTSPQYHLFIHLLSFEILYAINDANIAPYTVNILHMWKFNLFHKQIANHVAYLPLLHSHFIVLMEKKHKKISKVYTGTINAFILKVWKASCYCV